MFGNASDIGTKHQFPVMQFGRAVAGANRDFCTPAWDSWLGAHWHWQEFISEEAFADQQDPGFAIYTHSPTGTPTKDYVANAIGGQLQIKLTNNSQLEGAGYYRNDKLHVRANLPWLFLARLKIVQTMAANQDLAWGFASALNTLVLDNITRFAWFRMTADADLMIEVDDDTNARLAIDTGLDITADTFYWFAIERDRGGRLTFSVSDGNTLDVSLDFERKSGFANPTYTAANFQPIAIATKSTGTTQPEIVLDGIGYYGLRA